MNDSPKPDKEAVEQSLDLLAWAFLRPLGANGLPNAGTRKQRLQLYEPIVSGSADRCCARSSLKRLVRLGKTADPSKENSITVQNSAIKAGQDLMACWKAGQSHRIKYPSTLYISLNSLKAADALLPKLKVSIVIRTFHIQKSVRFLYYLKQSQSVRKFRFVLLRTPRSNRKFGLRVVTYKHY